MMISRMNTQEELMFMNKNQLPGIGNGLQSKEKRKSLDHVESMLKVSF